MHSSRNPPLLFVSTPNNRTRLKYNADRETGAKTYEQDGVKRTYNNFTKQWEIEEIPWYKRGLFARGGVSVCGCLLILVVLSALALGLMYTTFSSFCSQLADAQAPYTTSLPLGGGKVYEIGSTFHRGITTLRPLETNSAVSFILTLCFLFLR